MRMPGHTDLITSYYIPGAVSPSSKVMLKIVINRLQQQAEAIIAEEQAVFNLKILCKIYLYHH